MRFTTALLAMAALPAVAAKPCIVSWSTLAAQATARGLSTTFEPSGGTGTCFRHKSSFVASASDSQTVACKLQLLVGAAIKSGWTVTVIGDIGTFQRLLPEPPDFNPMVVIRAEAGKSELFRPASLEFSGPDSCDNWLAAISWK